MVNACCQCHTACAAPAVQACCDPCEAAALLDLDLLALLQPQDEEGEEGEEGQPTSDPTSAPTSAPAVSTNPCVLAGIVIPLQGIPTFFRMRNW